MSSYDRPETSPFDDEPDGGVPNTGRLDTKKKIIWKGMSVTELLRHRAELDACLPARKIEEVNVEELLLLQLRMLQELQTEVISDDKVSLQHRVQVANAVSKGISDLADRQSTVYNSERLKRLETALIRTCREHMTEEASGSFLDSYKLLALKLGA